MTPTPTVTLEHPIADGKGSQVSSLTLRPPIVADLIKGDMQANGGSDNAADAAIVAEMTGLPFSAITKIDARDWVKVVGKCIESGFFPRRGGGGGTKRS